MHGCLTPDCIMHRQNSNPALLNSSRSIPGRALSAISGMSYGSRSIRLLLLLITREEDLLTKAINDLLRTDQRPLESLFLASGDSRP